MFIGTHFSNLYTAVETPARGRVVVCLVFVGLGFKPQTLHSDTYKLNVSECNVSVTNILSNTQSFRIQKRPNFC